MGNTLANRQSRHRYGLRNGSNRSGTNRALQSIINPPPNGIDPIEGEAVEQTQGEQQQGQAAQVTPLKPIWIPNAGMNPLVKIAHYRHTYFI